MVNKHSCARYANCQTCNSYLGEWQTNACSSCKPGFSMGDGTCNASKCPYNMNFKAGKFLCNIRCLDEAHKLHIDRMYITVYHHRVAHEKSPTKKSRFESWSIEMSRFN